MPTSSTPDDQPAADLTPALVDALGPLADLDPTDATGAADRLRAIVAALNDETSGHAVRFSTDLLAAADALDAVTT